MKPLPPPFTARVVAGFGQGKGLETPTLNLDLAEIPAGIAEGVYAAWATLGSDSERTAATIHWGPRPVFDQPKSFEVHVLDSTIEIPPSSVTVELVAYLREVKNFPSVEALKEAIAEDIRRARAILTRA